MGMATYTKEEEKIHGEFKNLHLFFNKLKKTFLIKALTLKKYQWVCLPITKLQLKKVAT